MIRTTLELHFLFKKIFSFFDLIKWNCIVSIWHTHTHTKKWKEKQISFHNSINSNKNHFLHPYPSPYYTQNIYVNHQFFLLLFFSTHPCMNTHTPTTYTRNIPINIINHINYFMHPNHNLRFIFIFLLNFFISLLL